MAKKYIFARKKEKRSTEEAERTYTNTHTRTHTHTYIYTRTHRDRHIHTSRTKFFRVVLLVRSTLNPNGGSDFLRRVQGSNGRENGSNPKLL